MNYKQAVEAALQGNANAFSALYESTQNNMYYLALKYMKNPDDAKDVLQDAYIKAWQSLPTLKDPEHFPAWLGRIVANTAKNMLVKKKPDLFSELEKENEDGDEFVFQIEDENTSYQPVQQQSIPSWQAQQEKQFWVQQQGLLSEEAVLQV